MKKLLLKSWLISLCLVLGMATSWAETVTATMTAGENGSAATVNEKDAIKVGTSKKGGDMTITVPANATSLTFYAAAWKGVTDLSLEITPAVANPASVALTADEGIANNSPFTLDGEEEDYKFTVSLSNITTEKVLTLTGSSAKRFVVWGATCEVDGEAPGGEPGDEPGDEPGTDPADPKPLPAGVIFYESFDQNEGTGGNDDKWNGSIATSTIKFDNEGWTTEKGTGAYKCAKFGTGSVMGVATTPAIDFAGDCTLVFFAAAWDGTKENTTLNLSAEGATLSEESVTLTKGAWDIYEVKITDATPGFKITFSGKAASDSRFFLDEVEISAASYDLTITEIGWATLCLGFSYAAPEGVKFYAAHEATTTGIILQEVTTGVKGSLAVFAYGTPGTYRVKATDDYDSNFQNILEGVLVDTPCEADANYVLGITSEGTAAIGLHHGTTLKANRGYIPAGLIPAHARGTLIIDVETGIEQIATEQMFGKVYDLQGRELKSLQKGFNIMNGKKVIVK